MKSYFAFAFAGLALTSVLVGCHSRPSGVSAAQVAAVETPWKVLPIYGGGYVQNVVICPSDPDRWYCYVDVGGPYRSDDAGAHWYPIHINFTVDQRNRCADHVRTLSVDPRDADSLVIASGNNAYNPAGIYVSRDGGATYRQTLLARFYGNGNARMYGLCLARNPLDPDELVAGEDMDGLFVSRDNGETWKPVGLDGHWFTDIRYDLTVPGRLYACAPDRWHSGDAARDQASLSRLELVKDRKSGFYRSDDGGLTWRKLSDDSPDEICQIAGEKAIVGTWGGCGQTTKPKAVKISFDGGATWQDHAEGLVPYDYAKMKDSFLNEGSYYAFAAGPDFMLIGDSTGGIYRRNVGEAAWRKVKRESMAFDTPDCEAHLNRLLKSKRMEALGSLIVDARDASHWLATDWYHIWESHDAGANWTSRTHGMMQLVSACIDFDPFDRERIRYGVADMGYFCSTNGGATYFKPAHVTPYAKSIAHSLKTPGLVLATGGKDKSSVCWSQDGGLTWRHVKAKSGLPTLRAPAHLSFSAAIDPPTDDFYIAVSGPIGPGKGGVYRSHDRGETWEWFSAGLPEGQKLFKDGEWSGGPCSQLVFSPDGSALLCSALAHVMYRLDRAAGRWEKVPVRYGQEEPVADPHTPGRFILPGWRMLESTDGGRSFHPAWTMPSNSWMLAFDARVKGLVVFGHGSAIYVSRDGGLHSAPLADGLKVPSGGGRRVAVDDGRLFLMTSGSGVFVRDIK